MVSWGSSIFYPIQTAGQRLREVSSHRLEFVEGVARPVLGDLLDMR
jgi:hypothetical protein